MSQDYKVGIALVLEGSIERRIMEVAAKFSTLNKTVEKVQASVNKLTESMMVLGQKASGQASVIGQSFIRATGSAYDLGAAFKSAAASAVKMGDESTTAIENATLSARNLKRALEGASATPVIVRMKSVGGAAGRERATGGAAAFAGGMGGMAGLAGFGALGYGLYESAKMQGIINNALLLDHVMPWTKQGRQTSQHARHIIEAASSETGISTVTLAKGFLGLKQVDPFWELSQRESLFPMAAKAALLQEQYHGTAPEETIKAFQELAHQTQKYKIKDVMPLMNYLNWAIMNSPVPLTRILNASSYAMPTGRAMMNVDPSEILESIIYMQAAGVRNTKSGTWLSNAILNTIPKMHGTGLFKTSPQLGALREMKEVDANGVPTAFDSKGIFHPFKMIQTFLKWADHIKATMPTAEAMAKITQTAGLAWGKQGSRFVALAMSPGYERIRTALDPKSVIPIPTMFNDISKSNPLVQGRKLINNISVALQKLADHAIPDLTAILTQINGFLNSVIVHPGNAMGHIIKDANAALNPFMWVSGKERTSISNALTGTAGVAHDAFSALLKGAGEVTGMANGGIHITIHDQTTGGIHAQMHKRQIHETGSTLTHSGVIPATVGGAH